MLFGTNPGSVANWSGIETFHALQYASGAEPVQRWLHLALADCACLLSGICGKTVKPQVFLEEWGFHIPKAKMSGDDWLKYAEKHEQSGTS